jgi:hypothetical protein
MKKLRQQVALNNSPNNNYHRKFTSLVKFRLSSNKSRMHAMNDKHPSDSVRFCTMQVGPATMHNQPGVTLAQHAGGHSKPGHTNELAEL